MTVNELKLYIYDNGKVEDILETIGCHHIRFHSEKNYWTCGNCNGDNVGAIVIRNNEYLNVHNYTREKEFGDRSDLFTLIQYNLKAQNKSYSFYDVIKYTHEILHLKFTLKKDVETKKEEKPDPLLRFKMIRKKASICVANDYEPLKEETSNFAPFPHISFAREGIMPWTWKKFGLGYNYYNNRTIIPLRYWMTGELIGYNMRTSVPNSDVLGIKKYLITPGYPKQINIYGLWENKSDIQKAGYVIVYEAEKSVLKRDTLFDATGVALSGHAISREQCSILIGLNVEIIIAFDKDVDVDYLRYCCEQFYRIRRVSYIYDSFGLLGDKDSPADAKDKDFQYLLQHRISYDDKEHFKYINSLQKMVV